MMPPSAVPAAASVSTTSRAGRLDWRTIGMVLPQRRFTPAELARAVPEPASASLRLAVILNLLTPIVALIAVFGRQMPPLYSITLVAFGLGLFATLSMVWRDPGHRLARWLYYLTPFFCGLLIALARPGLPADKSPVIALGMFVGAGTLALWFGIVYRHQYIAARLRELDERDRAIALARQLATAQVQPHFLFNSLASLQQWVSAGDARAAPLLASLTGYLRATLPLFELRELSLGQELEAVRRYLEVMQARWGDRLRFAIHATPAAEAARLPPGVLLTLVENAVEHGIGPQLSGGEVRVEARCLPSGEVQIDVLDDGAGLPAPPAGSPASRALGDEGDAAAGGLGLRNTRSRLAQAHGPAARLSLVPRPGGGCCARVVLPAAALPSNPPPERP